MTDKEKADCLIELHKEESAKHKNIIDLEFKVNISLWSFIIFAGYFLLKEVLPTVKNNSLMGFAIGYLLIASLTVIAHYNFWLFPITRSQAVSNYFIKSYLCKIEELVSFSISSNQLNKKPKIERFRHLQKNYREWILFEGGITVFLLLIIFLFGIFKKIW